jgi:hypothetical protein
LGAERQPKSRERTDRCLGIIARFTLVGEDPFAADRVEIGNRFAARSERRLCEEAHLDLAHRWSAGSAPPDIKADLDVGSLSGRMPSSMPAPEPISIAD